jgi:hypothetical protein
MQVQPIPCCVVLPNDIEFTGEKEGAQRLTMNPL